MHSLRRLPRRHNMAFTSWFIILLACTKCNWLLQSGQYRLLLLLSNGVKKPIFYSLFIHRIFFPLTAAYLAWVEITPRAINYRCTQRLALTLSCTATNRLDLIVCATLTFYKKLYLQWSGRVLNSAETGGSGKNRRLLCWRKKDLMEAARWKLPLQEIRSWVWLVCRWMRCAVLMLFVAYLSASLPGDLSPAAPVLGGAETRPSASAAWTGPRADWRPEEEEDVKWKERRNTESKKVFQNRIRKWEDTVKKVWETAMKRSEMAAIHLCETKCMQPFWLSARYMLSAHQFSTGK